MQLFSVQPSFSAVLRSLMAILFSLVLAACGGGGGSGGSSDSSATSNRTATSSPKAPARTLTLEGVAMKGAIANGLIKVYGVEEHASHYQLTASPLAATVRTKNDGSFRIQFSPTDSQAWVIQLTADEHTTMTCDLTEGCQDAQGGKAKFGAPIKVPANFEMYAAVLSTNPSKATAHITPLTHLAYQWAAQKNDGLTPANITQGRTLIATTLGLSNTALDLKPLDITRLTGNKALDDDQLDYSILSASFLSLAQGHSRTDITQVLDAASQRFASWGRFPEVSPVPTEVSLSTVLQSTASLAEGIAARVQPNSGLHNQLKSFAYASSQLVQELTEEAAGTVPARLVISYHPGSQTVKEQDSVTFNVNASGGSLRYQWRKDGQVIPGATSSTLTLSRVLAEDAGRYDCVVSNETQSLVSKAATLTVTSRHITLNWEIPAERVDGSPLHPSELSGYRILYGTRADQLTQSLQINDPYVSEQRFDKLQSNTYYFSIVAIDDRGNESALSNIVEATL